MVGGLIEVSLKSRQTHGSTVSHDVEIDEGRPVITNRRRRLADRKVDEPIAAGKVDAYAESVDANVTLFDGPELPFHPICIVSVNDHALRALDNHANHRALDIFLKEDLEIDIQRCSRSQRYGVNA